jgi:hypothetical protein
MRRGVRGENRAATPGTSSAQTVSVVERRAEQVVRVGVDQVGQHSDPNQLRAVGATAGLQLRKHKRRHDKHECYQVVAAEHLGRRSGFTVYAISKKPGQRCQQRQYPDAAAQHICPTPPRASRWRG